MTNLHMDNLLLIVVGAHLRAEQADRPLAYRLKKRIEAWLAQRAEQLNIDIEPIVCSDLWYLNQEHLQQRPTISIGGPGVNALSAYFAQQLPSDDQGDDQPQVIIQLDPEFTDLRVCLWGMDHKLTVQGLNLFCRDYLPAYLTAVATQVEPKVD